MRKSLCFLTKVIPFVLFFASCRKLDTPSQNEQDNYQGLLNKFFNNGRSNNQSVNAVADAMYKGNLRKEFIKNAIEHAGYPKWDHAMVATSNGIQYRGNSSDSDSSSIVYVPFVQNDSSTNAVMVVQLNPTDTLYTVLWPTQYLNFGFDTLTEDWNAKRIFRLFTNFDNAIFGHTKFILPDGRIFGGENNDTLFVTRVEEYYGTDSTYHGRNNAIELTYCLAYDVETNVWNYARSSFYSSMPYVLSPICGSFTWYPEGGGNPPASNVPEGVTWTQPPTPIGETGSGVWFPDSPSFFTPEPYDSLLARVARFCNQYAEIFDSIGYINGRSEACFDVIDVAGSSNDVFDTTKTKWGTDAEVSPDLLVPSGKRLRAVWHPHLPVMGKPRSDTTTRSGPSGDDVANLYKLLYYDPPVPVITDCGTVRYFILVENKVDALKFFKLPGKGPVVIKSTLEDMVESDPIRYNNSEYHELTIEKLLLLIGSSSTSGIGVYKSTNPEKTQVIKLN